jgi:hypothetical protein
MPSCGQQKGALHFVQEVRSESWLPRVLLQRIPDAIKSKFHKILDVGGGEFSYALLKEEQRQPRVVDAVTGEVRPGRYPPQLLVRRHNLR